MVEAGLRIFRFWKTCLRFNFWNIENSTGAYREDVYLESKLCLITIRSVWILNIIEVIARTSFSKIAKSATLLRYRGPRSHRRRNGSGGDGEAICFFINFALWIVFHTLTVCLTIICSPVLVPLYIKDKQTLLADVRYNWSSKERLYLFYPFKYTLIFCWGISSPIWFPILFVYRKLCQDRETNESGSNR